ncbi:MAG: hypothetical protein KDB23_25800, partial [Planctomycetales bacterium]|nr:hypothetical protein [Planctomycetales bacterium]
MRRRVPFVLGQCPGAAGAAHGRQYNRIEYRPSSADLGRYRNYRNTLGGVIGQRNQTDDCSNDVSLFELKLGAPRRPLTVNAKTNRQRTHSSIPF